MDANPPFRCRRRGAPIRPRGRRSVDAGRTPECIRGRPPLWRGPPADCDRVLASLRGHRCARLAFPDRALPTLAPAGAPADQVGRRGRCCRDRHLARFPALGWLAMGRDARAAGDAGRRRVRARRARSTHQPRDRYAPPPPLRHRPPHQPHARVRRDDRGTWRPLRPGDPRAADGAPSAHPGERAGRRALDARRGSALQPGAYPHPTRRRSALLPPALRRGADAVVGPRVESAELVARARALLRIKVRHDAVERQAAQFTDWTQSLVSRVAEQVEELQRVERLRRFLAPQVAQIVADDEKLLESHRREIAAVFCDLRGFTAFSEAAEPEEVMSVLREYHDALGGLVFEFEATLERFAGDAILAFFNDPVPCPDPAARAVRMAVAMRERVQELVVGWRKRGHDLDFGVGIALGYATLGRIGFAGRFDYGAVGTVVNLAARLCAEALGGQILLSERAHTLVEDLVEAEPLAPLRLKGFLRPVKAVNVVALRAP